MRIYVFFTVTLLLLFSGISSALGAGGKQSSITITEKYSAFEAYEKGFAKYVMRGSEGIRLFDRDLLHDDGPGAGYSEKGSFLQPIYGKLMARKDLDVPDIRTNGAFLVFLVLKTGSKPLTITINGNKTTYDPSTSKRSWKWLSFEPSWLKKGGNTILFSYTEGTKEDLWHLMISRKDEFERGGGDSSKAGLNSYVSIDGGKSWKHKALGETGDVEGEFNVRLSLDRYLKEGWLASPVIDLWRAQLDGLMIPMSIVKDVRLFCEADVPKGTSITWQARYGPSPDPLAEYWSEYRTVGGGAELSAVLGNPGCRYFQWKAILKTTNPQLTPVVRTVTVERDITRLDRLPDNIYVLEIENPEILYSSLYGAYERWDEPKLKELREREKLDDVVADSRTQFEMMVMLCDYVSKRWVWVSPIPQYPAWDAIEILDRIDKEGGGGMCIHFSIVLIQAFEAYGIQARLQNCVGHEVVEAWSDDYGKWVFFDPMQDSNIYNYSKKNGEPLSFKELHDIYLDLFYPDRPIDWSSDPMIYRKIPPDAPVGAGTLDKNWPRSETSEEIILGLSNAAWARMMPRNDWMENHNPSPIAHGDSPYPWTGYINWYDERTPRMHQHKNYTDREADYWPTLNLVKIYAITGPENDRLFLRFTTFTPNFDTYLVEIDEGEWIHSTEYFPWVLHSGINKLRVRVRNKSGDLGKPSLIKINLADRPNLREGPGGNE